MNNTNKLAKSLILFSVIGALSLLNTHEIYADETNTNSETLGQSRSYGGLTYQKTNVRYRKEWSNYTPVSYNRKSK